jgi:hypothetical protein
MAGLEALAASQEGKRLHSTSTGAANDHAALAGPTEISFPATLAFQSRENRLVLEGIDSRGSDLIKVVFRSSQFGNEGILRVLHNNTPQASCNELGNLRFFAREGVDVEFENRSLGLASRGRTRPVLIGRSTATGCMFKVLSSLPKAVRTSPDSTEVRTRPLRRHLLLLERTPVSPPALPPLPRVSRHRARPDRAARPLQPSISVIIPTLNEAGNLPYVINTIPPSVSEIIIVDGRSNDDTERVASLLSPNIVIVRETKRGKGAALQAGFRAARGDILLILDADGSMNGADVSAFVQTLLNGADYVKGSRFMKGGGSADITPIRRFGDRAICLLIFMGFGVHYSDGTYGLKAFWRDCLDLLHIDADGFEVELLMDIRAHRSTLNIAEVPCFETVRIHGNSNLNAVRDGFRCLKVIIRERLRLHPAPLSHEYSRRQRRAERRGRQFAS